MNGADVLAFARGPALWLSLAVLVGGSLWRLAALLRLGRSRDLSAPRDPRWLHGAARGIVARMLPGPGLRWSAKLGLLNAYAYHLGLAALVFGYVPHIEFFRRLTGLGWPALPDAVVYVAAGIAIVSLFLALLERLSDPVLRLLSSFDDYFSWLAVMLPCLTGMAVIHQSYAPGVPPAAPLDPLLLAVHLLSVELLLLWLPFGKLAHAFLVFLSRGVSGAALARKGAAI